MHKQGKPTGLARQAGGHSRALGRQDSAGPEGGAGVDWAGRRAFQARGQPRPPRRGAQPGMQPLLAQTPQEHHPGLRLLRHPALLSPQSSGRMKPSLNHVASGAGGRGCLHCVCSCVPTDYVLGT